MSAIETFSLYQIGAMMHMALENYDEIPMYVKDELVRRCPEQDKAQGLFDYHVKKYLKTPNQENFFETYALLVLIGELAKRTSQAGGKS